jgi:hypothetical protein
MDIGPSPLLESGSCEEHQITFTVIVIVFARPRLKVTVVKVGS